MKITIRNPLIVMLFSQALLLGGLLLTSGASAGDYGNKANVLPKKDIVEVAIGAGQFNTLAAALKAAGLVETLQGEGPFTVFAPTDAAFAALPAGTVESLLEPANRAKLTAILTYHVVPGRVSSDQVVNLTEAATVNGESVSIAAKDGQVRIDDATVITADIAASNGIIHVIDSVIMPKS